MKRKKWETGGARAGHLGQAFAVLLTVLAMCVCGVIIGRSMEVMADGGRGPAAVALTFVVLYLGAVLAAFLQIAVHELGHLVCGLLTGYGFVSFRLAGWMIVKREDGLKLKRFSLPGTGGQCLLSPPEPENGRFPYALYDLGGVLFNRLAAAVSFALALIPYGFFPVTAFWLISGIIGAMFALTNGIPLRLNLMDNDGRNALDLKRGAEARRCLRAQLQINAAMAWGVRLKNMPDEWFAPPAGEARRSSICAAVSVFACLREMDRLRFSSAAQMAEELLGSDAGLAGVHRYILASQVIFCELVGENRPDVLETYRTKGYLRFEKAMRGDPSILCVRYAWELLANRNEPAAEAVLAQFERAAKTYPHESEIESDRELLACAAAAGAAANRG